jgi:hypothetical protein
VVGKVGAKLSTRDPYNIEAAPDWGEP